MCSNLLPERGLRRNKQDNKFLNQLCTNLLPELGLCITKQDKQALEPTVLLVITWARFMKEEWDEDFLNLVYSLLNHQGRKQLRSRSIIN